MPQTTLPDGLENDHDEVAVYPLGQNLNAVTPDAASSHWKLSVWPALACLDHTPDWQGRLLTTAQQVSRQPSALIGYIDSRGCFTLLAINRVVVLFVYPPTACIAAVSTYERLCSVAAAPHPGLANRNLPVRNTISVVNR